MFKPKRGKSTILYIEERPLILWLLPLVNIINSLFKFDCLPAFSDHITFQLCKTEKGERYVHMKEDGADCFRRIIQNRKHPKIEPMIDGYSGFLFLDKNDMTMVALHWEKHFQHIREKYNSILRRDEKGCGLKGLKIARYLAQTKEKLCKVILKYAKNVNKKTIIEILQNCCKCRKIQDAKH